MELAKRLNAADDYFELRRETNQQANATTKAFQPLREQNPYGFDVVVDATGDVGMLSVAIDLCAKGGKIMFYCVYSPDQSMTISPAKIFQDEISIIG